MPRPEIVSSKSNFELDSELHRLFEDEQEKLLESVSQAHATFASRLRSHLLGLHPESHEEVLELGRRPPDEIGFLGTCDERSWNRVAPSLPNVLLGRRPASEEIGFAGTCDEVSRNRVVPSLPNGKKLAVAHDLSAYTDEMPQTTGSCATELSKTDVHADPHKAGRFQLPCEAHPCDGAAPSVRNDSKLTVASCDSPDEVASEGSSCCATDLRDCGVSGDSCSMDCSVKASCEADGLHKTGRPEAMPHDGLTEEPDVIPDTHRVATDRSLKQSIRTDIAVSTETSTARKMINNPVFESVFACLILFNAICMAMEQQYYGSDAGYKLGYPGFARPAKDAWPQAETVFVITESFFGVVFTVEVIVKLIVFRCEFFTSLWNLYDAVIILCWFVQNLSLLDVFLSPLLLRFARIARLLRLLRFAKTFQVFDVLHLLIRSLQACMSALMWSALFVTLVMTGTAILLVYLLEEEYENEQIPLEERLQLYRYFGTFTNALFSMYELTMANWVPIARTVVDNVGEWYMLFFVTYRTIVGFALLKVVTAIFNAETFRVSQSDDDIMLLHKERQVAIHTRRMKQLLFEGDVSGDGKLGFDEFQHLMKDKRVQKWLLAQEIEFTDLKLAFKMLDQDGDGSISTDELVRGLSRMKGVARSMEMNAVIHAFSRIEVLIDEIHDSIGLSTSRAPAPVLQQTVPAGFFHRMM
eukprot:TRINITY_DN1598_c0_g1_i1.p1 TRINITY_DN1598_c0_g1~~TRINITY_DN1598_c0_g1_i1.p1  ORF type:complete len:697 (+),score=94.87 TRINITY_DN1598_c0_g1_i1:67-2157(+)